MKKSLRRGTAQMGYTQKNSTETPDTIFINEEIFSIPIECPICGFRSKQLYDANDYRRKANNVQDSTNSRETSGMTFCKMDRANKSDLDWMIYPFTQSNKKDSARNKGGRDHRVSLKPARAIKNKQGRPNHNKGFIPVVYFHICKKISYWLHHISDFILKGYRGL
ncbi:hypothetical protein ACVSTU_20130 [Yersinia enterocolitica]